MGDGRGMTSTPPAGLARRHVPAAPLRRCADAPMRRCADAPMRRCAMMWTRFLLATSVALRA
ncbi:hypothetical protein WT58_20620 [Burkholderia territorii]|nr:hypothetical protein WT58_20620 [Burkholderia territorii]